MIFHHLSLDSVTFQPWKMWISWHKWKQRHNISTSAGSSSEAWAVKLSASIACPSDGEQRNLGVQCFTSSSHSAKLWWNSIRVPSTPSTSTFFNTSIWYNNTIKVREWYRWCGIGFFPVFVSQYSAALKLSNIFAGCLIQPHRGQPPCCGGGALHRWPEKFLKSGGEELTKRWQKRESRLLHVTSAFVLVSASQPTTALLPSIYGFTAVYGFIAATRNHVGTFGDAHWVELIRPQRWAGVTACPPQR